MAQNASRVGKHCRSYKAMLKIAEALSPLDTEERAQPLADKLNGVPFRHLDIRLEGEFRQIEWMRGARERCFAGWGIEELPIGHFTRQNRPILDWDSDRFPRLKQWAAQSASVWLSCSAPDHPAALGRGSPAVGKYI